MPCKLVKFQSGVQLWYVYLHQNLSIIAFYSVQKKSVLKVIYIYLFRNIYFIIYLYFSS